MTIMFTNDHKCFFNGEHLHFCLFHENIPTLLSNNKCTIYMNINDHKKPEVSTQIFSFSLIWIMTIMFTLTLPGWCGHLICKISMSLKLRSIMKKKADYLDHVQKTFENICGHLVIYQEHQR